jgi:pyruvate dehydrogenase E2 component (dihydrolipoamide acetyltransferase)
MPVLGADMDEGTVLEWLVKPGDEVRKGDVIAVIDTAKSAIDVESFCAGTVEKLVVDVGETVPVGTVLAAISEPAGRKHEAAATTATPAAALSPVIRHRARELGVDLSKIHGSGPAGSVTRNDVERAAAAVTTRPTATEPVPAAPAQAARTRPAAQPAARNPVTPRARRVAAELGVDLDAVSGTGPNGTVREADVRRAAAIAQPGLTAETAAAAPLTAALLKTAPAERSAGDRALSVRRAIARLMARSKREIPHYYVSNTADMTIAMRWLKERNRELAVTERLVPAVLLLKATALAAQQVPELNGYWTDDQLRPAEAVNLGLAISLRGGGLLTPAIHDAASLSVDQLMARMRDLVVRARSGRLRGSELTDGTITVTNLGDQGVESVFGVIYPPQVALVGFGKIKERAIAVNGLVGARPVVVTTLAADHRATDGYTGARFLVKISELLDRPEEL